MSPNAVVSPAFSRSKANNKEDESCKRYLRSLAANEFIFAVVGPAGSGTSWVATALKQRLENDGIEAEIFKASDIIQAWAVANNIRIGEESKLSRAMALQDAGDMCRLETKDMAAVSIGLMSEIKKSRNAKNDEAVPKIGVVFKKRAYILDSLKHPAETALLRQTYRDAFCQIGVVCEEKTRRERLIHEKCKSSSTEDIERFMKRDEDAGLTHGQKVTATFHLSDFFVDNTPPRLIDIGGGNQVENPDWDVADQLIRLIDIITHRKLVRPRPNETGMFHAYGAQMRSTCLSRQVGAALVDAAGNVVSTGTNEVPRAGGGVYGGGFRMDVLHGRDYDHRCAVSFGKCANTVTQNEIIQVIIDEIPELKSISDNEALKARLRKTPLGQLIEFSRAVHAEMDALLSAARQGTSTIGTRLFVTTFPCHYCARHIIAAGVDEVQFIEPYLKSRALKLHGDAITQTPKGWKIPSEVIRTHDLIESNANLPPFVLFRPFTGVAPRLYRRAFLKDRDLKNNKTGEMEFGESDASIRPELLRHSYIDVENELINKAGFE